MASVTCALVCAIGAAGATAQDDAPLVSLGLSTSMAEPVPQGARIAYELEVTNPGPDPVDLVVFLSLDGPGAGDPVEIEMLEHEAIVGDSSLEGEVFPARWLDGTGTFTLSAAGDDGSSASLPFEVGDPELTVPRFENVTDEEGIGFTHHLGSTCNGTHTAGAAWADVEGDGDLDLYVPDQRGPARLFLGNAGGFTEGAAAAGVRDAEFEGYGSVFADYDNDGDPDLFVTGNGTPRLYENDGAGGFTNVAAAHGLTDPRASTSASLADYDGDGRLDLYLSRWGGCTHEEYLRDSLYRQGADGVFTEVTDQVSSNTAMSGRGFLGGWLDYDLDADQDLYLANDFTQGPTPQPNALWRNDGPGAGDAWRFTNVTAPSGTGFAMNSMGLAIGDYDRDLDPDVAVSNIHATRLLRNRGDGSFDEVADAAGVARPTAGVLRPSGTPMAQPAVTWGLEFADLNNDGNLDLYKSAGTMDFTATQPNAVLAGTGGGDFHDLSAPSGADDPQPSRGVAVADYDADGRLDLYVVNRGGEPHLFRNVTPRDGHHWFAVDTLGSESNADGCGARLRLTADGLTQSRWVNCGSTSLGSGSDATVHFGLGDATAVERLRVEWPSGAVQTLTDLDADQRIELAEPEAPEPPGPGPDPVPRDFGNLAKQAPWMRLALDEVASQSLNPPRASRLYAHLSASFSEALRLAKKDGRTAKRPLPRAALFAGAAGPLLERLLPDAGAVEAAVTEALEQATRKGRAKRAHAIGEDAAAVFVRRAELDYGDAKPAAPEWAEPGDWEPTYPGMKPALEPGAGGWTPWNLRRVRSVMPAPPPEFGSARFDRQLREVYDMSFDLTNEERGIAEYWADGAGTVTPPGHWNEIALRLIARADRGEKFTARVLEALNTAQADSFIACWKAKYHYFVVRPITEIRSRWDADWETVVPTPPFPSYPSGHSSTSSAAANVLAAYFPKKERRLRREAREAGISRVYGGIHYQFDNRAGWLLGQDIAKRALKRIGPRGSRRSKR